jgi:hypothetical protein
MDGDAMTNRDLTLGATWRRLVDLGYAPTSATHPDRIVNAATGRRESFIALGTHPAAVMLHPTRANGACEALEDLGNREVIALVLTAYLLSDPKQARAVQAVLEEFKLLGGPVRVDGFGNQVRPLRWNGSAVFEGDASARLVHDDDDATVFIQHAIAPSRYLVQSDMYSRTRRIPVEPVGTHILPLEGEWRGGTLLDTPRDRLPELLAADVQRLIGDVERARWDARAPAKGAAA